MRMPGRDDSRARSRGVLRAPRTGEPVVEVEARRDPADRRRPAPPVPRVGRRGRSPGHVAAVGDRRRAGVGVGRTPAGGARLGRALRRERGRHRAARRRDRAGWSTVVTSPRKYPRTARLNESLLEVLAEELERLSDPRLELVTITGVDVTRDLSRAKVFYSTLGAETTRQRPGDVAAGTRPPALRRGIAPHLRRRRRPSAARSVRSRPRSSTPTRASSPASASRRSCAATCRSRPTRTCSDERETRGRRDGRADAERRRRADARGRRDHCARRASRSRATSAPTVTRSVRCSRCTTCCAPPGRDSVASYSEPFVVAPHYRELPGPRAADAARPVPAPSPTLMVTFDSGSLVAPRRPRAATRRPRPSWS